MLCKKQGAGTAGPAGQAKKKTRQDYDGGRRASIAGGTAGMPRGPPADGPGHQLRAPEDEGNDEEENRDEEDEKGLHLVADIQVVSKMVMALAWPRAASRTAVFRAWSRTSLSTSGVLHRRRQWSL